MMEIFSSQSFLTLVTIFLSSALGIFVRFVSRSDRHRALVVSDFAIGLEIVVALITVLAPQSISHLIERNQTSVSEVVRLRLTDELTKCILGLLGLVFGLWVVSTIIRKLGWKNENDLHFFWGILFPNAASFFAVYLFFKNFNFIYQ